MTALDRARSWFLAPPPPIPPAPGDRTAWYADPTGALAVDSDRASLAVDPSADALAGAALVVDPLGTAALAVDPSAGAGLAVDPLGTTAVAVDPSADALAGAGSAVDRPATAPYSTIGGWQPPVAGASLQPLTAAGGWQPPVAGEWIGGPPDAVGLAVTSAAVLGRPGEAEPIAAALALALRRETRARAAVVAVVGPMLPTGGEATSGGGAARRLGARLEAHGLAARVRGRLAWARLDPEDPQLVATARRVTLVAAPAVLAITAPRTTTIDEALAEQDLLVIVASDPEGALAQLAAVGLESVPVVTVRPLGRGVSRSLASAGVRAPRSLRALVPEAGS